MTMSSRDLGVEQWIETHTIECIPYAARLSPRQCGLQQARGDRTFCPCAQAATVRPITANGERRALLKRAIDALGLEQVLGAGQSAEHGGRRGQRQQPP